MGEAWQPRRFLNFALVTQNDVTDGASATKTFKGESQYFDSRRSAFENISHVPCVILKGAHFLNNPKEARCQERMKLRL